MPAGRMAPVGSIARRIGTDPDHAKHDVARFIALLSRRPVRPQLDQYGTSGIGAGGARERLSARSVLHGFGPLCMFREGFGS